MKFFFCFFPIPVSISLHAPSGRHRPTTFTAAILFFSCLVGLMPGCNNPSEKLILDQGRSLVEQGLQAWMDKKSPDDLKSLTPSITFFDDDWNRKAELLSYEFDEPFIEPSDGTARIVVFLKIREASGRQADVRCAYQVVVDPEIVIARDPMS